MSNTIKQPPKKGLYISIAGVVLVALCCFTPLLVITLGVVGFSVFTPHLDYVLFPALALMIGVAWWSFSKYKKDCKACNNNNNLS